MGVELVGQAHPRELALGERAGPGLRQAAGDARRERDVFADAQVGKEVELLEHHADAGSVGVERVVVAGVGDAALEPHLAGVGHDEEVEAAKQGGFSRAAGTEDGGDGAGADGQRHAIDGGERAVGFNEVAGLEHGRGLRRHGGGSGFPARGRAARRAGRGRGRKRRGA